MEFRCYRIGFVQQTWPEHQYQTVIRMTCRDETGARGGTANKSEIDGAIDNLILNAGAGADGDSDFPWNTFGEFGKYRPDDDITEFAGN